EQPAAQPSTQSKGKKASSPIKPRRVKQESRESGVGMGIVETWVREKPIRTFLSRISRQSAAAFAASTTSRSPAAADGEGGAADGGIPQLSSVANSVVSRCSRDSHGFGVYMTVDIDSVWDFFFMSRLTNIDVK
uniref:Uncharacterized protein n=1 Tax=Aegilops tauschii subsp. strangulata TaxID=200361 RepID=A0A453P5L0_AEGTS